MNKAYEDLANAIIIQAVKDIRQGNKYEKDARRFLESDWFEVLSKVDGRTILKRLDEEIAKKRKRKLVMEAM
ncbi:MAG: hypothetical protein IJE60_01995 [Tyzzerella sp.]|nr:hypothetical protein [Tyzzerella sp.]